MTAPTTAGRYNPDDPSLRYGMSVRHAALTAAASGVRVRRGRLPVEQVLLAAAVILFPLGLVFILLGWYGAAHTGRLYAQIDYLISGGLLGVGISVAGGFMYFGYWLSRQLSESRRQNGLTLQSLQRLEDLLEATLDGGGAGFASTGFGMAAPVPAGVGASVPATRRATATAARARVGGVNPSRPERGAPARPGPDPDGWEPTGEVPVTAGPVLLATPRGTLLHRPQCPVVAKRSDLRSIPAGTAGFGYCSMCDAAGVLV